jgi:hypothetical protein
MGDASTVGRVTPPPGGRGGFLRLRCRRLGNFRLWLEGGEDEFVDGDACAVEGVEEEELRDA